MSVGFVKEDLSDFAASQSSVSTKTGKEAIAISRNILDIIAFFFAPVILIIFRRMLLMEEISQFPPPTLAVLIGGSRVGSLTNFIIGSVFSPSPALIINDLARFVHPQ
eukprot:2653649-Heterocapsa_arctica.AAC.1